MISEHKWENGGAESLVLHGMASYVQAEIRNGNGLKDGSKTALAEFVGLKVSEYLKRNGVPKHLTSEDEKLDKKNEKYVNYMNAGKDFSNVIYDVIEAATGNQKKADGNK